MEGSFESLASAIGRWFDDLRITSRTGDSEVPPPSLDRLSYSCISLRSQRSGDQRQTDDERRRISPGRTVPFLGLPARPFPCRFPALLAAITPVRLPRMEALLAPFQQAAPHPPNGQSLPLNLLIFALTCRILGRAHGR